MDTCPPRARRPNSKTKQAIKKLKAGPELWGQADVEAALPGMLHEIIADYAADKASYLDKNLVLTTLHVLFQDHTQRYFNGKDALVLCMQLRVFRLAAVFAVFKLDPEAPDCFIAEDSDVQLLVVGPRETVSFSYLTQALECKETDLGVYQRFAANAPAQKMATWYQSQACRK